MPNLSDRLRIYHTNPSAPLPFDYLLDLTGPEIADHSDIVIVVPLLRQDQPGVSGFTKPARHNRVLVPHRTLGMDQPYWVAVDNIQALPRQVLGGYVSHLAEPYASLVNDLVKAWCGFDHFPQKVK